MLLYYSTLDIFILAKDYMVKMFVWSILLLEDVLPVGDSAITHGRIWNNSQKIKIAKNNLMLFCRLSKIVVLSMRKHIIVQWVITGVHTIQVQQHLTVSQGSVRVRFNFMINGFESYGIEFGLMGLNSKRTIKQVLGH